MANMAVLLGIPRDYNPIHILLRRKGKSTIAEPPAGYAFLTDERKRLLRDERGAYLVENKED